MTINVDSIINTVAGVIEPSGDRLEFTGLMLTKNQQAPTNTFLTFDTLLEVNNFFGTGSAEANAAAYYFNGFDNATKIPAKVNFHRWNDADSAAYLAGGSHSATTLSELQAIIGSLTLIVDGDLLEVFIDLGVATSFSNAATIIQTALNNAFTAPPLVTYNATRSNFIITSSTVGIGSSVDFAGGGIAAGLLFDVAGGATQSVGQDAATLTETLNAITVNQRNWVGLLTIFEPTLDEKLEIASWSNSKNDDFLFLAWDTNSNALNPLSDEDFGSKLLDNSYSGSTAIYGGVEYAAFMAGMIASIDTDRDNGWITLAYKSQEGLLPNISDSTDASTLEAKKYNFYGDWASRSQNKKMLMHGAMAGRWDWVDDFLGQIYLRSGFQESSLSLLKQIRRLPYNAESYEVLKSVWSGDVINPAIDIGIIAAGIALDTTQRTLIDSLTGVDGSGDIVSSTGWFLDVSSPSAAKRVARESPTIIFIYTSGQSIHRLHIPVFLAQ